MSVFVDEHEAEANSIKGRAYQAVNAALNDVFEKYAEAHGLGFVGNFKKQAITDNRVQRRLPVAGYGGDGTLANDAAIRAFATKGLSGKTTALAYAWNVDVAALADNPAPGDAVNTRYNNHADLAGAQIDYNLRDEAAVLNLAQAKAKLEDPHHDGT